jgi:hypothetical protein
VAYLSTHRQGQLSRSADSGTEKTASEFFLVLFDAPSSSVTAETSTGVPLVGASHPEDSSRRMRNKQAVMVEESNRMHWIVQCDYSNLLLDSPLNRPAKITWDFSGGTENYFLDKSATPKPVVNTSGEPFEKLPEREKTNTIATWKKNVAGTVTANIIIANSDLVNAASFTLDGTSWAAKQAKISGGSLSEVKTENGVQYRELSVIIKFRDVWDDVFEDRGFSYLVGTAPNKVREPIVAGKPPRKVDKPYPLTNGKPKANPSDPGDSLTFKPYVEGSFGAFSFT